jgi:putative transposase
MTRLARMVVSGLPHHVTQRGNRREPIFFEDGDQEIYRDLLGEQARKADVEVWAYCLMPNHVHLILNARGRWTGHLFQSRFASVAMDESHLISAVCYVSLNPVRARLVARAEDWSWSSVMAHINGADDGLVTVRPVLDRIPHFAEFLSTTEDQDFGDLRLAEGSGRPVGTADFVTGLERLLGRPIARRAPGRKPTASVTGVQLKLLQ